MKNSTVCAIIIVFGVCGLAEFQFLSRSDYNRGDILFTGTSIVNAATSSDGGTHLKNVAFLDLLPWEQNSIFEFLPRKNISNSSIETPKSRLIPGTGVCEPPAGVKDTCCLGTSSGGGDLRRLLECTGGPEAFERTRQEAIQLLHPELDCDICRILDLAHKYNLTISFWGDSVQSQIWGGFQCEMTRRNYTIVKDSKKDMRKVDNCTSMFCLKSIHSVEVTSPSDWTNGSNVKINFFFQYRPKETVELIYKENFKHILEAGTDVLFFNFGIHWPLRRKDAYVLRITKVLETLQRHAKDMPLLVFRESAAQHFQTVGGEFPSGKGGGPPFECVRLDPNDEVVGWRNPIFWEEAQKLGYKVLMADPRRKEIVHAPSKEGQQEIVVAPFLNFTNGLHDLHGAECTHYCSTPHLWSPLWRSLRLSMEWRFGGGSRSTPA